MRRRNTSFTKGIVVGLVVGIATTLTLSATAATGKKAWDRFGYMFKSGYVAGFLDCVRIAKGFNDQGYLAKTYTLPPGTSGLDWIKAINALYSDDDYSRRELPQILVVAGERLTKKFGPELKPVTPNMGGLRAYLAARREAMLKAKKAKTAEGAAKTEGAGKPDSEQAEGAKSAEDDKVAESKRADRKAARAEKKKARQSKKAQPNAEHE
ncbi:MAG: hypothetical protein ACE5D3_07900 [Candidatus Binatia bacterium]